MTETGATSDPAELIERSRATYGAAQLIASRQRAEGDARRLLDEAAGSMTHEQGDQLLRLFNTGDWGGRPHQNRFVPAFVGNLRNQLLGDMDRFNRWTGQLWDDDEQVALRAADQLIRDKQALPGAGRSYPTMLLYLRDPEQFAIWMNGTDRGLSVLTDYEPAGRSSGSEGYKLFCQAARRFRDEYGLAPQELDAVLSAVQTPAAAPTRSTTSGSALGREAFGFMSDLVRNNHQDWMAQNRDRYKRELKKPFRRLLEHVGGDHLADLDPELETEAKFGKVLAGIRKRWPSEEGEYNDHYWGAFSRGKKQEDIQLFVILYQDELRFGLGFYAAQAEQLEAFRDLVHQQPEAVWRVLEPLAADLIFRGNSLDREEELDPLPVHDVDDLKRWVDAVPRPSIVRRVEPDDPRLGTLELNALVGETLAALLPLARAAWGDGLGEEASEDAGAEDPGEVYSLDDFIAETHLPAEVAEEWLELLDNPKRRQALFYGPPGTGKTFVAERLGALLAGDHGEVEVVQFHPAFSYEDLIEGLRPVTEQGQIRYEVRPGLFTRFCERARGQRGTYVFVIDEINRADLGSVLGELMLLLEYRGKAVQLPYSQRQFSVPRNIILLTTMNTADRSLALVDFALRRRFHAIAMPPNEDVLASYLEGRGEPDHPTLDFFRTVQTAVADDDLAPGHSYWMAPDLTPEGLDRIWRYELKPYLAEHWHEQGPRLDELDAAVQALLAEGT
jgi:uncharacterized protein (DUF2461 family)